LDIGASPSALDLKYFERIPFGIPAYIQAYQMRRHVSSATTADT
jgi:hypothetical protein